MQGESSCPAHRPGGREVCRKTHSTDVTSRLRNQAWGGGDGTAPKPTWQIYQGEFYTTGFLPEKQMKVTFLPSSQAAQGCPSL